MKASIIGIVLGLVLLAVLYVGVYEEPTATHNTNRPTTPSRNDSALGSFK